MNGRNRRFVMKFGIHHRKLGDRVAPLSSSAVSSFSASIGNKIARPCISTSVPVRRGSGQLRPSSSLHVKGVCGEANTEAKKQISGGKPDEYGWHGLIWSFERTLREY